MKVRTAYLDTSFIGDTILSLKEERRKHVDDIITLANDKYITLYTSEWDILELKVAPLKLQDALFSSYKAIPKVELSLHREIDDLAGMYLENQLLTEADAYHLAYATFYMANIFLTLNRRTIIARKDEIKKINDRLGHPTPVLVKPVDFLAKVKIVGNSLLYKAD